MQQTNKQTDNKKTEVQRRFLFMSLCVPEDLRWAAWGLLGDVRGTAGNAGTAAGAAAPGRLCNQLSVVERAGSGVWLVTQLNV